MSETKVLPCGCEHPYQDATYGHKQRVHNAGKGKNKQDVWRCTVCKGEKS